MSGVLVFAPLLAPFPRPRNPSRLFAADSPAGLRRHFRHHRLVATGTVVACSPLLPPLGSGRAWIASLPPRRIRRLYRAAPAGDSIYGRLQCQILQFTLNPLLAIISEGLRQASMTAWPLFILLSRVKRTPSSNPPCMPNGPPPLLQHPEPKEATSYPSWRAHGNQYRPRRLPAYCHRSN